MNIPVATPFLVFSSSAEPLLVYLFAIAVTGGKKWAISCNLYRKYTSVTPAPAAVDESTPMSTPVSRLSVTRFSTRTLSKLFEFVVAG
jgi:hypothetical protein